MSALLPEVEERSRIWVSWMGDGTRFGLGGRDDSLGVFDEDVWSWDRDRDWERDGGGGVMDLVRDARDVLADGMGASGSGISDAIFGRFVGRSILIGLLGCGWIVCTVPKLPIRSIFPLQCGAFLFWVPL